MNVINLPLKKQPDYSYDIYVGSNISSKLPSLLKSKDLPKNVIIITNPVVKKYCSKPIVTVLKDAGFAVKILIVPDSEKSKSAGVAFNLIEDIAKHAAGKKVLLIALGGGVIGDLTGYVAATYKRGVPYIQVPTTLLAQVDSAIGGKVAVDLSFGKNLVGAFYQPKMVLSDVSFLDTLSQRQLINGLAEVLKYGVIADKKLFNLIEDKYQDILSRDIKLLSKLVLDCSSIKAKVVSKDERETSGLRMILNFGHTIGHAIEAALKFDHYYHGEAIALGMRAACEISVLLDKLSDKEKDKINNLISLLGLPEKISDEVPITEKEILEYMVHDKKFLSGKNRFILPCKVGKVDIVEGVSNAVIKKALGVIF